MSIEQVTIGHHKIERFKMKLNGVEEIWDISINHTRKAIKIQDLIIPKEAWPFICSLGPINARKIVATAIEFGAEILTQDQAIIYTKDKKLLDFTS